MAIFEKTMQPQKGVYGRYTERRGAELTIYAARAGDGAHYAEA